MIIPPDGPGQDPVPFPGVTGNKALSRVLTADNAGVWWVTCFAVDSHYRRSGVGLALFEFTRQHGATAVEGHATACWQALPIGIHQDQEERWRG
jgi:GNAT superfamily N-acetyltransferase